MAKVVLILELVCAIMNNRRTNVLKTKKYIRKMENRGQRCDRVLSDPNAVFGWRCAEILGVSGELSKMGADIFRKFVDGVMKAQRLFGNSNFEFTD